MVDMVISKIHFYHSSLQEIFVRKIGCWVTGFGPQEMFVPSWIIRECPLFTEGGSKYGQSKDFVSYLEGGGMSHKNLY